MKTERLVLPLSLIAIASGVVGCSASTSGGATTAGLDFVTYEQLDPGWGDGALLTGTVANADGCFAVRDSETGSLFIPIFPDGAGPDESLVTGDELALPGGVQEEAPSDLAGSSECLSMGPYWLVSASR
jgi:hypothetical protein